MLSHEILNKIDEQILVMKIKKNVVKFPIFQNIKKIGVKFHNFKNEK